MRVLKESFNAGEFTPRLHSRYELAKYKNGCKTLTNFVPLPQGPVTRRPGTEYIAAVADSTSFTRLIPFEFSEEDSYMLEFGPLTIRYYKNGAQLQTSDAGTVLLLHFDGADLSTTITDDSVTPHTVTAVGNSKLRTTQQKFGTASLYQIANDDYLTIPDHADWNFGAAEWTIDFWVYKPAGTATSVGGFWSQSNNPYDSDERFEAYISSQYIYLVNVAGGTPDINAVFTYQVGGFPEDEWVHVAFIRGWASDTDKIACCVNGAALTEFYGGLGYFDATGVTLADLSGVFVVGAYNLIGTYLSSRGHIDEFRVTKGTARWTSTFTPPTRQYPDGDDSGAVYETTTTYTEAMLPDLQYVQSADVMYIVHKDVVVRKLTRSGHVNWTIGDVSFTDAPAAWSAGDYPRTVEFFEDRLVFGGSPDQPDTIWTSHTSAYHTFTVGDASEEKAITLTLLARKVNDIQWLSSSRRLLSGTRGEEWWAAGPSDTEPMTPADHVARKDSAWGSARIMPVNIGDIVFYIQQGGRTVRELIYDYQKDKYISSDMNVLAEHLTKDYKITAMAYQQQPYQVLWCVRSDGTVLALTYLKEHDVFGWSKHTFGGDGAVESVAVIPGDTEDEVWFVIKRTINSSVVRYVEKLTNFNFGTALEDAFFVDSGLSYNGTAATAISGLSHLEGEAVVALADGSVVTGLTVASGAIALTTAASKVHIGLANTPEFETLDVVAQDNDGTLQGILKRITNVSIRLINSMGGLFGPDSSVTDSIDYRDETALFTGWVKDLSFDEQDDVTSTVYITCDEPLPLEIAAINIDLEDE